MTGLILVLIAFVLFIIETHVPSFGIFGVLSLIALFTGGSMLVEQGEVFGIPIGWETIIGIAVAMVIVMVYVGKIATRGLRAKDTAGTEGMIGADAIIEDWAGKTGRVMVQGELWQAFSERDHDFKKGDAVTISETHDLKLKIRLKD